MNVCEYAWDLLQRNNLRLEALLEAAHNQEVNWLEFKADPFCLQDAGQASPGEVIWHTLKAVVAMVNGCGGCIVFGIDNGRDHQYVPLKLKNGSDVPADLDEYYRQIKYSILAKQSFTKISETGEKTAFKLKYAVNSFCTLKSGVTYHGRPVGFCLVNPSDGRKFCIVTVEGGRAQPEERLYWRDKSDMGDTEYYKGSQMLDYERPVLTMERSHVFFDNMLAPVVGFVGRTDLLERMEQALSDGQNWRIPLLYGPPGIGKTQIALRYAQLHHLNYEVFVQIDGSAINSFPQAISVIARNPDFRNSFLSGTSSLDQATQGEVGLLMSVRQLLSQKRLGRVLLLIDNVRDPNVLRPSVVFSYLGVRKELPNLDVVFTSRSALLHFNAEDGIVPMAVGALKDEDGLKLLSCRRMPKTEREREVARKLVSACGYNPWALDLVGDYLQQKRVKGNDDYEVCLNLLRAEVKNNFPPHDWKTDRQGNVTGVLGVRELLEPTLNESLPEERDICSLLSILSTFEDAVWQDPLFAAYSYLRGNDVPIDEWTWLIQLLKDRCVIRKTESAIGGIEGEIGQTVISFSDRLFALCFAEEDYPERFYLACVEAIRSRCRFGGDNRLRDAGRRWRFLKHHVMEKEYLLDVIFDDKRLGWPLGLLGVDNVTMLRNDDWGLRNGALSREDVLEICEMAADRDSCRADVLEIKGLMEPSLTVQEQYKRCCSAYEMRKTLYANRPDLLCRSELHLVEMSFGLCSANEIEELLVDAAAYLREHDSENKRFYGVMSDRLAYEYDQLVHDGVENETLIREKIGAWLKNALHYYPEQYEESDDLSEDAFKDCVEVGKYPR